MDNTDFLDGVVVIDEIPLIDTIKILILAVILIGGLLLIANFIEHYKTKMVVLGVWGLIGVGILTNVNKISWFHSGRYQYQVVCEDGVSMDKFQDYYKIIGYDDGVYTIELKEE